MNVRIDRIVAGAAFMGALVFACTSPVNDDVVIPGRTETPQFGGPDASGPAPDANGSAGLCPSNECPAGRVSCPNEAFPCGVDLLNDDDNCGACGARCPTDDEFLLKFWGVTHCISGTCRLMCASDFADCNGILDDGCEVAIASDSQNCGACGVVCQGLDICVNGTCECRDERTCPCPPGRTRCPDEQCHDLAKEDSHCGACGNLCPESTDPPFPDEWNMGRACGNGKCNQPRCIEKWADCNGDGTTPGGDGCETSLITETNCGSCGYACQAGEVCRDGQCQCACGSECFKGIQSDIDNCGTCDFRCPGARVVFTWSGVDPIHGKPVCDQGVCGYTCKVNWADCDADTGNGCEADLARDPLNCGGCGIRCDGIEGHACVDGHCLMKECGPQ